ncbi:MAG: inorganic diphosphatase [Actinomycetota bacterium]|nr:inorganic diphosphatase [Actinomycetota bacterium]
MSEVEQLNIVVEVPKGSRNKYEYDPEIGAIVLDRFLFSSMVYPVDYGFVPHTMGADNDPLDAMVCVSEPTFPGCVIPSMPIGLFRMTDDGEIDDKILCVPSNDPNWSYIKNLDMLSDQLREEIAHFFSVYKQPEGKHVDVDGWYPLEAAMEVLEESRQRLRDIEAQQKEEAAG